MQFAGALQYPRIGKALVLAFKRLAQSVKEAAYVLRREIRIAAEGQRQCYGSKIGVLRISALFIDDAFQLLSGGVLAFADCW
jgi:hypothetical protein